MTLNMLNIKHVNTTFKNFWEDMNHMTAKIKKLKCRCRCPTVNFGYFTYVHL